MRLVGAKSFAFLNNLSLYFDAFFNMKIHLISDLSFSFMIIESIGAIDSLCVPINIWRAVENYFLLWLT